MRDSTFVHTTFDVVGLYHQRSLRAEPDPCPTLAQVGQSPERLGGKEITVGNLRSQQERMASLRYLFFFSSNNF